MKRSRKTCHNRHTCHRLWAILLLTGTVHCAFVLGDTSAIGLSSSSNYERPSFFLIKQPSFAPSARVLNSDVCAASAEQSVMHLEKQVATLRAEIDALKGDDSF